MDRITEGKKLSDMCWFCVLCGDEVPCESDDDPPPKGWQVRKMRTGIGLSDMTICGKCARRER